MTNLKPSGRVSMLVAIAMAGLVLVGLGFTIPSLWRKGTVETPEENQTQGSTARPAIPPIDQAIPANLETATFALG